MHVASGTYSLVMTHEALLSLLVSRSCFGLNCGSRAENLSAERRETNDGSSFSVLTVCAEQKC